SLRQSRRVVDSQLVERAMIVVKPLEKNVEARVWSGRWNSGFRRARTMVHWTVRQSPAESVSFESPDPGKRKSLHAPDRSECPRGLVRLDLVFLPDPGGRDAGATGVPAPARAGFHETRDRPGGHEVDQGRA